MELIYDTEKSMLPDAQGLIELRNEHYKLLKKETDIRREIYKLQCQIDDNSRYVRAMRDRITHRENTGTDRPELSDPNRHRNFQNGMTNPEEETPEGPKYMRPCPSDLCRGFLNRAWFCGMCRTKVCSHCHEIIEIGSATSQEEDSEDTTGKELITHECKPENVESAKEVMSHSKPCPKCNVFIFKIDGCNQMFCTNCHTAFDWRTRTIVKGAIHNPHYFAWLEENGRPAAAAANVWGENQVCGGDPVNFGQRARQLYTANWNEMHRNTFPLHSILILVRHLNHLGDVVIPKYEYDRRICEEIRVRFLEKIIDEEEFKREIYIVRAKEMRNAELRQLYEMVHMSVVDIMRRMFNHLETISAEGPHRFNRTEDVVRFLNEIYGVIDYANTNLAEIPITYGTTTKQYLNYDLSCGSCNRSIVPTMLERVQ